VTRERALGFALTAWLLLTVLLPLASAIEWAGSLALDSAQWQALARAWSRGSMLALVVATISTALAALLARTVPPILLLALLLTSRAIESLGVLALGMQPGVVAAGLALVVDLAPLAALVVLLRLRTRPVELIESAADLGAGPWVRARLIGWPHLQPAFLVAFVWALLEVLGDAVALEIAGGGKAYTPGLLIRDALVHEHAPARAVVGLLGLLIVALPCAWLLAGELRRAEVASFRPLPHAAPVIRALGFTSFAMLLAIPAALLLGEHPQGFGTRDAMLVRLLGRTAGIAGSVALLAAVGGFLMAIALGPSRSRAAVAVLVLPLALPASVFGLLALAVAGELGLHPGIVLTVLALLPQALALGFLVARVLSSVVPRVLIEAAADLGANAIDRLRLIWLPLGRPALLVAFAVVFTWVLGQSATPAFTSGPGGDTLAVGLAVMARGGDLEMVRRWALAIVVVPMVLVAIPSLVQRFAR
jgi:ABC-type spermidine/putrescine transport system permease subunit II